MGADGAICNHMACLELRLVIPAGARRAPRQLICAPSNSPEPRRLREGETGSPKPVLPERSSGLLERPSIYPQVSAAQF